MKRLKHLMKDVSDWTNKEFGKGRSPIKIVKHLQGEINETKDALRKHFRPGGFIDKPGRDRTLLEFSDILILLLDSSSKAGFSSRELVEAAEKKMEINKNKEQVL